jgi:hypothetical protein
VTSSETKLTNFGFVMVSRMSQVQANGVSVSLRVSERRDANGCGAYAIHVP